MNDARLKTLITVDELARLLDDQQAVVLLGRLIDELGASTGRQAQNTGLVIRLSDDGFFRQPTPASGRRPLPDISEFQSKARAWGIGSNSIVVVYDNSGGAQASRAWWTLRWAGLANVRVWMVAIAHGLRPTAPHQTMSLPGCARRRCRSTTGCMPTIGAEEAAALAKQSKLLDARPRAALSAILPKQAPDIFLEPFTRLQAITSPMENSNRTMTCTPAFLLLEQIGR